MTNYCTVVCIVGVYSMTLDIPPSDPWLQPWQWWWWLRPDDNGDDDMTMMIMMTTTCLLAWRWWWLRPDDDDDDDYDQRRLRWWRFPRMTTTMRMMTINAQRATRCCQQDIIYLCLDWIQFVHVVVILISILDTTSTIWMTVLGLDMWLTCTVILVWICTSLCLF